MRTFFRTNEQPIFFISPTAFNLLGIDRWVRGFEYIVYHDSWDGAHPRVFCPSTVPMSSSRAARRSSTTCCATQRCRASSNPALRGTGLRPMVAMVFFDEETEQICEELDYNLILPKDELRRHLDTQDRHHQTRRAGRCALGAQCPGPGGQLRDTDRVSFFERHGLHRSRGADPYGDSPSGKTTFFIVSEADWDRSEDIAGEELKI